MSHVFGSIGSRYNSVPLSFCPLKTDDRNRMGGEGEGAPAAASENVCDALWLSVSDGSGHLMPYSLKREISF